MKLDRVIAVRNNKTIYRDGDRAIKVFNAEYSKADVLNEALNQARIEETGLNIPKVLEVTMIDGKWAIVSEFIKGKTLAQLMEENPEKKGEYIELLVDLQMSVHAKTSPLLNKLKDKMNRKIAATVQLMREQHIEGVVDVIPAFCSLLINYDPRVIGYEEISKRIKSLLKVEIQAGAERKKIFEIPVCYGGEFGPDIANVHTTEESLCISSVQRVWEYLKAVLAAK